MRLRSWLGRTVALALAISLLGACARIPSGPERAVLTNEGSQGDTAANAQDDPSGTPTDWVLPLEAYVIRGEDLLTVRRAINAVADECLARKGFTVRIPEPKYTEIGNGPLTYRRYALVSDLETAREFGYHVNDPQLGPEDLPGWPDAAYEALVGSETESNTDEDGRLRRNGCFGEADRQLAADTVYAPANGVEWPEFVDDLNLSPKPAEDPKVLAAQRSWSECMVRKGYELESTVADIDVKIVDLSTAKPSATEIDMAVADVECQSETGVARTWFEVERAFQLAEIARQPEQFATLQKENAGIVRKAVEVLAD
jgi:hypothetical protein